MRRLLIRPGALGDLIVWLPAAEHLLTGGSEIWCAGANRDLVAHLAPSRAIEGSGLDLLELPGAAVPEPLIERLKSFDEIVSWYGTARAEFRDALARLGVPARFFPALPRSGCPVHAVDFYLDQVGAAPGAGAVPRIPVTRVHGGYAVIHPFSGSPRKNWPLENFHEAARLLAPHMEVKWCAGPDEPLDGAHRFPRLADLASFLAGASVYIGNDSGPSHLAAAGAPVIALFGPTDPLVWTPRGRAAVVTLPFESSPAMVAEAALRVGIRRR
ncbi:MAG: glycosyltransferase family 9 protein [Bryobacteraceae bacterium]|nr:glycosyltransferase family 9 protein [Bryobacteraceae bacterium]